MNLHLPDGASLMPEDLQRRLQFGDPASGWPGNVNMFIRPCKGAGCRARQCDGWVVAESMTDGSVRYIMHNPSGYCNSNFLEMLAKRYKQTANELVDEIESHNNAIHAAQEARSSAAIDETANRLYDVFKRS